MEDISDRQKALLKIVIDEYIATGIPVGSENLAAKHKLKYSPATARNEMASLIRKGFLEMKHTSSGRVPTGLGFRYYINNLMTEEEIPVLQEVAMKQRVWQDRYEFEKLLRSSAAALAHSVHGMAIVSTNDGFIVYSGGTHVLDEPEFWDIEVAKATLNLFDDFDLFYKLISKSAGVADIKILIGSELEYNNLTPCGFVFTDFVTGRGRAGTVGVFGTFRMPYFKVIPALRYMRNLMNEVLRDY